MLLAKLQGSSFHEMRATSSSVAPIRSGDPQRPGRGSSVSPIRRRTRLSQAVPLQNGEDRPCILIAEDHPDSREALRTLLEVHGYRVVCAADGRRAVEEAIRVAPDLIVMDIMMPEMDGFEATRQLRANEQFRQVPIVALTAMEGARDMVLAAGCDDYMSKPIDVRRFLERVRGWMEAGRPGENGS